MSWFRRKPKTAGSEIATKGAYRIKTRLDNINDWVADIYDSKGRRVATVDECCHQGPELKYRDRSIESAKKWIDRKIEKDRLLAEAKGNETDEWYGVSPGSMQKTITSQQAYIEKLEAELDEFRRPDGSLDVDAMTVLTLPEPQGGFRSI